MFRKKYLLIILPTLIIVGLLIMYKPKVMTLIPTATNKIKDTLQDRSKAKLVNELTQSLSETKTHHIEIEDKNNGNVSYAVKAEVQSIDHYKGELSYRESGQIITKKFIVVGDIAYVKSPDKFDDKYAIWKLSAYPEIAIPQINDLATLLKYPHGTETVKKDNLKLKKISVATDLGFVGSSIFQNKKLELYFKDDLPYEATIKNQSGENAVTIRYSGINKSFDIEPPTKEEIIGN